MPRSQICLVIGTPRGFTRSVLEALLKRGSRVILACPEAGLGIAEQQRLSALYGSSQISLNVVQASNLGGLESMLLKALDTHGGITHIVNSTTDNKLPVKSSELCGSLELVERYLDQKQQQHEVQSIKKISKLAVKYLGKHNGFQGGTLLNLVSRAELQHPPNPTSTTTPIPDVLSHLPSTATLPQSDRLAQPGKTDHLVIPPHRLRHHQSSSALTPPVSAAGADDECCSVTSCCTVLGTTRALGLDRSVGKHGVKVATVYQPHIDYPELSAYSQITDEMHSPYYTWNRYSAYCREYTGYMALHVADTTTSGTAWSFNSEMRLQQVDPSTLPNTCKLTNKMCYWLGCPHTEELPPQEAQEAEEIQSLHKGHSRTRGRRIWWSPPTPADMSDEWENTQEHHDS